MPKTNSTPKNVRSFRLSREAVRQLMSMSHSMGRSESDVLEVALDRMYREEIRFNRALREASTTDYEANRDKNEEEKDEIFGSIA